MWNAAVPDETRAISEIRRAAHDHLVDEGLTEVDDLDAISVMVSELVTNAICHGAQPVSITVSAGPKIVRVEVRDGSTLLPRVLGLDPERVGGNGMRIVDVMSTSWGVDPASAGKSVWFEVTRQSVA